MCTAFAALVAAAVAGAANAQQPPPTSLTLTQAIEAARRVNPDVRAARAALAAATGRARQASAYPNPTLSYGREQTSAAGETNPQNIAAIEQRIELGASALRERGARAAGVRWWGGGR